MLWFKIFLILKVLTLVFFAIIALIPLRFHLYYQKKEENDDFVLEIQPPRNILYQKIVIPSVKLRDQWRKIIFEWEGELGNEQEIFLQGKEEVNLLEEYRLIVASTKKMKEHISACDYLMRYVKLHKFELILKVGTGNPAYTGMITGLLWGTVPALSARILNKFKTVEAKPFIEIAPDFTRQKFDICLDSIFTLKIGHIITIGSCILMQEIKSYFKRKRKLGKKGVTDNG